MATQSAADAYEAWKKTWPKIVARAWADPTFMQRLTQEPLAVAQEYNLPTLGGITYKIVAGNEPPTLTLSIPPKPSNLTTESLDDLAETAEDQHSSDSSCT